MRGTFRLDIQALRGVAIVLVLLFHAWPSLCPAGYLGVDVFFVVSGFLIAGLIKKEMERGAFTLRAFYYRRAKRLLPAAYVTFAGATLAASFLLTARERFDFRDQLLGGISFSSNFVLWRQINYFNPTADLKPLLHIWSLAIEEQFYLLLPGLMLLLPSRYWLRCLTVVLVGSAALCFVVAPIHPSAAFYLLPTRGWELALGCVGALWSGRVPDPFHKPLWWFATALLFVVPFFPVGAVHPRWDALLVCVATLGALLCGGAHRNSVFIRAPAAIGDFSYSLYLVHWPLLAFANNCWMPEVPTIGRVALLAVSIGVGYGLYRVVERPLWRASFQHPRRFIGVMVACSVALAGFALGVPHVGGPGGPEVDYASIRRVNFGLSGACEFTSTFQPLVECQSSKEPRILVWGDSFAMHLVPGLVATTKSGVLQATRSSCGSLLGVAPVDNRTYGVEWGESCIAFNESVFHYLESAASIQTVVLSSAYFKYVGSSQSSSDLKLLHVHDRVRTLDGAGIEPTVSAIRDTVTRIRSLGLRVVVVAPPPSDGILNVGECLERKDSGLPIFGAAGTACQIQVEAYHRYAANTLILLKRLPAEADVEVVSFDSTLCSAEACKTELGGEFVYRDRAHLSIDGSIRVAENARLAEQVLAKAR